MTQARASCRRRPSWAAGLLSLALLLASCASLPPAETSERADAGESVLFPGIDYSLRVLSGPRPLRIHVVRADSALGGFSLRTPAGEDTDGSGPAEASLAYPRTLARISGALVLVDASSFRVLGCPEGARRLIYRPGMKVDIAGLARSCGRPVSPADAGYAAVCVADSGHAISFLAPGEEPEGGAEVREAAAGFAILVSAGRIAETREGRREPRTAVGADAHGRLVLVVAEGRRPGASEGMTLGELARLMRDLGCVDALNLDGGGSCALVVRQPDGSYRNLIPPTDGFGLFRFRRPIPNALAIVPER